MSCFVICVVVVGGEELWSEADSSCSGQPIHLWQFLKELLLKPHIHGRCIRWLNKEKGIFVLSAPTPLTVQLLSELRPQLKCF